MSLFKLPSRQTHAGASDLGGTTNQRLLLFAYGSASRFSQGSAAHCGNCCQDTWQEDGPFLPTFVIYWPKLAAAAEVVKGEHNACSALPVSGPGLHSTSRSRHWEWGKGEVRWLLYIKLRNLYVHLSVVVEMERNMLLLSSGCYLDCVAKRHLVKPCMDSWRQKGFLQCHMPMSPADPVLNQTPSHLLDNAHYSLILHAVLHLVCFSLSQLPFFLLSNWFQAWPALELI